MPQVNTTELYKLLKEREVEERYGLPVDTLRSWRFRRVGPEFIKLAGRGKSKSVRYRVEALEKFIAESTVRTAAL